MAKAGALWRTIKYEDVYLRDYASPREVRTGLTPIWPIPMRSGPTRRSPIRPAAVYFGKGLVPTTA
jgi:hypothetical protein